MERPYFSERSGRTQPRHVSLDQLKNLFDGLYHRYESKGYFQYSFGKYCTTEGYTPGEAGVDLPNLLAVRFGERGEKLMPNSSSITSYSIDDLFDMIEFLYDNIANPTDTSNHQWDNCGLHVLDASTEEGQKAWREEWNSLLARFEPPYRLTEQGVIESIPGSAGLRQLVDEHALYGDPENVDNKVDHACRLFLKHESTLEDKHSAIRILADVLEFLREDIKKRLTNKDEGDLFNIANNFDIRHHKADQQYQYDGETFYPWIFYWYLATVDLLARLKKRNL